MYLGTAATSISFVLVFVAAARAGLAGLFGGPLGSLVYLISALVLLRALGAILWGFLRIEERTKLFNGAAVGTKAATIAAICALIPLLGRTAGTYLTGVIAVETVLVVTLTVPLFSRGLLNPECFDRALFRAGVFYGMPLAVYEFAFAVLGSADRFLVTYYLGPGALGFYSVAYGLAQHANELLVTPLILAILPIYMRIWTSSGAEKTQEFLSISLELFLAAAAGNLADAVAAARPAVLILASSKYAGAERMIPVLLAGLLIYATYVFLAAGLLIHKRTLQMAVLLVIAAAANIALNCLLLPRMGLMGSAVATLLSYALCIVLLGRASSRLLPLRIRPAAVLKFLAAAAVAAFAGARFDFGSVAADLAAKSGIAAALYCAALFVLDGRVRRAARWAYCECRNRL
jgi:O-antigen/teichoic acid export membrane protein